MKKTYEAPVLEVVRLTPEDTLLAQCVGGGLTRVTVEEHSHEARLTSRQVRMRKDHAADGTSDSDSFFRLGSPVD